MTGSHLSSPSHCPLLKMPDAGVLRYGTMAGGGVGGGSLQAGVTWLGCRLNARSKLAAGVLYM